MEQTTDARSEINRLNKIIDILTDQIGILKAENTYYKKYIASKTAGNTIAFSDNGNPEAGTSIAEKGNTSSNAGISIVEKGNASSDMGTSNDFFGNGNSEAGTSIVEKGNALSHIGTSIDFYDNGNTEAGTPIVEKANPSSGIGNPVAGKVNSAASSSKPNNGKAPDYIDPGNANKWKLERAIKHFFPLRTKGSKISSFASQMLLLYNSQHASYPEMRKVSGMSKGGFNKQAPDLRKKGFVVRASHQKYALTEMSKQIIDKVFGG